ncbi:MAG: MerR family transcriptional regulator [Candidatus Hydrogenedens sp.]|nr:MerR family transcriptional regulator [Candidatus Hydrogenedens sp.]
MSYSEPRHPMNVVTRRTGMTSHAIRVWEKRYNAVRPQRTDTNRRLYSDADIDRLRLLHAATQQGHAISGIASLKVEELERLLQDAAELKPLPRLHADSPLRQDDADLAANLATAEPELRPYLAQAQRAIEALDDIALEAALREALADFPRPVMLEGFVIPLMGWLGECWQSGRLRVAHEHFASSIVKGFLLTMRGQYAPDPSAPILLCGTPAGQHHEIGALTAAETASSLGWHVIYMGPSIPAEEIGYIARERHAAAIALSVVYPVDDPRVVREIRELAQSHLPAGTELLIGGTGAEAYNIVFDETRAVHVPTLHDLAETLHRIRDARGRAVRARA